MKKVYLHFFFNCSFASFIHFFYLFFKYVAVIIFSLIAIRCLKCKKLDPIFTAAARRLSKHKPPIIFGTVDVPKNMDTAKKFGFQNYPLLMLFRYGRSYNYTGEETEEGNYLHVHMTVLIINV